MTEELIENKYIEMGISKEVYEFGKEIEQGLKERFDPDRTISTFEFMKKQAKKASEENKR